jgi:sterol desaturase/sphingolipid hydroxylase (fatty acid hydroxylase superfamily)
MRLIPYVTINGMLYAFSLMQFWLSINYDSFFIDYPFFLMRDLLMVNIIDYRLQNNKYIDEDKRYEPQEHYKGEFIINGLQVSLIEVLTFRSISYYFNLSNKLLLSDLLLYIPFSFCYEIVFDFFHYITHRYAHTNTFLYKYVHKRHHMYKYPTSIIAYYQHPLDVFLTNSIPILMSVFLLQYIIPKISLIQLCLFFTYKSYVEIAGHSGKITKKASCFPQLMILPKLLKIELYTSDHDLHHTQNNCNYSKRFSIWDKIFGTFRSIKYN